MAEEHFLLRKVLSNIAFENNFSEFELSIILFSTDGANFYNNIFIATISNSDNEELSLFVKVATIGEQKRQFAPVCIYRSEIEFYSKILEFYKNIEERHNVPNEHKLILPKLYGFHFSYSKETLVLNNLLAEGYSMYDRFQTIDWDYASHSLTALAKLHGLSIAYSFEYPEEFRKDGENMKIHENIDSLRDDLESAIVKVLLVTKEENKDRLKKFLDGVTSVEYFKSVLKPMKSCVLTHADYRTRNLLHKVKDGKTIEVIPIDFQTIRHGNLVSDVVHFIFTSSDQQFRRIFYQKCLEHYYTELSNTLIRLHLDPTQIYSRVDFEYELKQASSYGLLSAILCLFVETDSKDTPKLDDKFSNELYADRINGVIEDFVLLGII